MKNEDPKATLTLSADEMRELGYRAVDLLVDYFERLPTERVTNVFERSTLEELFREPAPEEPDDPRAVLERAATIFAHATHVDHPRFFAFVPGPNNFVGAVADALVSGFNVFSGTWIGSSGPSTIEMVTIDWLRGFCGLPESAGGLFLSGGSMANLTALAVARHARLGGHDARARVYYSDQTHSSVDRALRTLGFDASQIHRIPSDGAQRLSVDALRAEVARDRRAGAVPFCVVANAGTTNSGAVDPLPEIAGLCKAEELWLHADGAYGAAATLSERGRALLAGLDRVDSLSLDPHKWLFQPFEIGCVLVRDRRLMRDTFHILPEYLKDTNLGMEEVNFCDYGVQLTRSFRALKLWMSLKTFGRRAFARAIDRGIDLAELAEAELRRRASWQVVTPAQLGIVTFRYLPAERSPEGEEAFVARLVRAMLEDGFAMATSTVLNGRPLMRLCTINPRTTDEDLYASIERMERLAAGVVGRE